MTGKDKMKALEKALIYKCTYGECDVCEFFKPEDSTDGEAFCGIRDGNGKIPYHNGWSMKVALGIEEPHKPAFPEEIENSIMRHFTRGE